MGRTAKQPRVGGCAYEWCEDPVKCNGLCQRHYNWEYYHRVRGHGYAYMKSRKAELAELEGRCEAMIGASKPRRKLRVVK